VLPLVLAAAALAGTAWLIIAGHRLWAGLAALAAGVLAMLPTIEAGPRLPRLAFAGRLLDRAFEAAVLAPVAWVTRQGSPRVAALALVALGASYLASYERARGEALGYREVESAGYRLARSGLMVFGLLTGWIEASLWALVAVTLAASAVRAANVARQERRNRGPRSLATVDPGAGTEVGGGP
jgi:phosphatidylinositol phosphate synthase